MSSMDISSTNYQIISNGEYLDWLNSDALRGILALKGDDEIRHVALEDNNIDNSEESREAVCDEKQLCDNEEPLYNEPVVTVTFKNKQLVYTEPFDDDEQAYADFVAAKPRDYKEPRYYEILDGFDPLYPEYSVGSEPIYAESSACFPRSSTPNVVNNETSEPELSPVVPEKQYL